MYRPVFQPGSTIKALTVCRLQQLCPWLFLLVFIERDRLLRSEEI